MNMLEDITGGETDSIDFRPFEIITIAEKI